jgi:hypothetical protein
MYGRSSKAKYPVIAENRTLVIQPVVSHFNDLRLSRLGISDRRIPLKIAAQAKQGSEHHWKLSKMDTGPRFAHGFQPSVCIPLYNKTVQATSRSHTTL